MRAVLLVVPIKVHEKFTRARAADVEAGQHEVEVTINFGGEAVSP
jgi:hypothetical protein